MFRFKQFTVEDSDCAHKVGTDGTLLGAWADIHDDQYILDIGTGSGLIALMLAQRTSSDTHISAVEFSTPEYEQAIQNVKQSPWSEKIKVYQNRIQDFTSPKRFDHIVSNPPFFTNSYKPPKTSRIAPRHTDTLSFEELLEHSKRLLDQNGKLSVILPNTEGEAFCKLAYEKDFKLSRRFTFLTRKGKPVERLLLEFCLQDKPLTPGEILLYREGETWSDEYIALTRDFYLKL